MNSKKEIGKRINKLRAKKSQAELAIKAFPGGSINAAQKKWSKIETGNQDATVAELFSIAKALGVKFEDIVDISGMMIKNNYFSELPIQFKETCDSLREIFRSSDKDIIQAVTMNVKEFKRSIERNKKISELAEEIRLTKGPTSSTPKPARRTGQKK